MVAVAAEELLQIVVRARQSFDLVTGEQPRPVATRHLHEVIHRTSESTRRVPMFSHRAQQTAQLPLHSVHTPSAMLAQHVSRLMHPRERYLQGWPQPRRRLQPARHDSLQTF
jgi:hypothetical protein